MNIQDHLVLLSNANFKRTHAKKNHCVLFPYLIFPTTYEYVALLGRSNDF